MSKQNNHQSQNLTTKNLLMLPEHGLKADYTYSYCNKFYFGDSNKVIEFVKNIRVN